MPIKLKPLERQTVVVTGASSGRGLAIACEAASRGAAVLLVSRNGSAFERITKELNSNGARAALPATFLKVTVTKPQERLRARYLPSEAPQFWTTGTPLTRPLPQERKPTLMLKRCGLSSSAHPSGINTQTGPPNSSGSKQQRQETTPKIQKKRGCRTTPAASLECRLLHAQLHAVGEIRIRIVGGSILHHGIVGVRIHHRVATHSSVAVHHHVRVHAVHRHRVVSHHIVHHGVIGSQFVRLRFAAATGSKSQSGCKCRSLHKKLHRGSPGVEQAERSDHRSDRSVLGRACHGPDAALSIGNIIAKPVSGERRRGIQLPSSIDAAFDDLELAREPTGRMVSQALSDISRWLDVRDQRLRDRSGRQLNESKPQITVEMQVQLLPGPPQMPHMPSNPCLCIDLEGISQGQRQNGAAGHVSNLDAMVEAQFPFPDLCGCYFAGDSELPPQDPHAPLDTAGLSPEAVAWLSGEDRGGWPKHPGRNPYRGRL